MYNRAMLGLGGQDLSLTQTQTQQIHQEDVSIYRYRLLDRRPPQPTAVTPSEAEDHMQTIITSTA